MVWGFAVILDTFSIVDGLLHYHPCEMGDLVRNTR